MDGAQLQQMPTYNSSQTVESAGKTHQKEMNEENVDFHTCYIFITTFNNNHNTNA